MIVETTDNQLFRVTETNDVNLAHVFYGVAVKRSQGGFIEKKNNRRVLVSKVHVFRVIQP